MKWHSAFIGILTLIAVAGCERLGDPANRLRSDLRWGCHCHRQYDKLQ